MSNKVLQFPIADLITPTTCNRNPLCLLDDIDHYEHSILMYLASTHPTDDIVNAAVERSVNQISLMTKISKSTVRVRLRSLVQKGYLQLEHQFVATAKQSRRQLANRYIFTKKIVEIIEQALTECVAASEEKLAVGQSFPLEAERTRERTPCEEIPLAAETKIKFNEISNDGKEDITSSESSEQYSSADVKQSLAEPMKPISLSLAAVKIPGIETRPVPTDRKPPASSAEIIRRAKKLLELYPNNDVIQGRIPTLIQTAEFAKFHIALSIYNRYDHLYVE